jgi:hypothetical protein
MADGIRCDLYGPAPPVLDCSYAFGFGRRRAGRKVPHGGTGAVEDREAIGNVQVTLWS